jgi:ankyrin repeat protein
LQSAMQSAMPLGGPATPHSLNSPITLTRTDILTPRSTLHRTHHSPYWLKHQPIPRRRSNFRNELRVHDNSHLIVRQDKRGPYPVMYEGYQRCALRQAHNLLRHGIDADLVVCRARGEAWDGRESTSDQGRVLMLGQCVYSQVCKKKNVREYYWPVSLFFGF